MRVPRLSALPAYVAAVTIGGLALVVVMLPSAARAVVAYPDLALLLVLVLLTVVGELFPLRLRFRRSEMVATTSTTFAFAILLIAGLPVASLVLAVASIITDVRERVPAWKAAFNIGQYTLALAASAAVAALLSPGTPALLADARAITLAELGPLVAAGAALLLANYVLITFAIALSQRRPVWAMLRRDIAQHPPMTFVLLLFAPVLVVIGQHAFVLLPLLLILVLALYRSSEMSMAGEHAALHDPLTELANRRLFRRQLDEALETRRAGQSVAVLIVDLDRFKPINDSLGHHVGDAVLVEIARRLQAAAPSTATVARLGGDEFAVLLPEAAGVDSALGIAEGVRTALSEQMAIDGVPLTVGGSVGIALGPQHGENVDELLQAADAAMYDAKRSGAGVVVHDDGGHAASGHGRIGRLELAGQLEHAISGGELVVFYQPIADISSGHVDAAEALVRWRHPRHGLIGPDDFIPMAEQSDLIGALTLHVLDRALAQCAQWHAEGLPMRIAVNLSAHSLQDVEFPAMVARALRTHGLDPRCLKLEITEHTVMADPEAAGRVLGELSAMGVHLAIDDFGTGYSSLARLQQLPIDEVKIDKSFVQRLTGDLADDQALVAAIVMFARQLGLRIVAEGVETAAVWDWLHTHGCTFAQGYYLSRPTDGSAFTAWLHARGRHPGAGELPRLRLVSGLGNAPVVAAPRVPTTVIEVAPAAPVSRDAG